MILSAETLQMLFELGAPPDKMAAILKAIDADMMTFRAPADLAVQDRRQKDRDRKRSLPPDWQRRRLAVFERDGWVCAYCGEPAEEPHCDHVYPLSKGGSSEFDNLTTACPRCNVSKGDRVL